jgi:o-succinylbenzoate---CoA ligase
VNRLVAIDRPGGPSFVDALQQIWLDGDAAFPVDRRLPAAHQRALVVAMGCAAVVDDTGEHAINEGRPVESGDALVVATSGSTGEPKGVVLTHEAVEASARATTSRIGQHGDDHWLACLPLAHVGGLAVITRALTMGIALTVIPSVDREAVAHVVRNGATLTSLVPTALTRLDASAFRTVVLGGSRPPGGIPANCVTTYGLTETGSGVVYDGVPLDGVEIRIDNDGVVHLRGPMLLRAYRNGRDPKDADGWFATGDLGHLDDDGRLVVQGRRGDLIITGGENVWPDTVETALADHPRIADVAVAGRPDPEWGHAVVAFVVPNGEPPTLAELRAHVRERLAPFAAPKRVVIVDHIPRTAVGKPRRGLLPD